MPFINERLAANHDLNQAQKGAVAATRVSRYRFEPDKVIEHIEQRIIGQPHVIEAMSDLLLVVKANIGRPNRPLATCMLLGPTGVGKTETVRLLAEAIHGHPDKLCRIDMNTLAQSHYSAALSGAPPGYVGSKEGQTLFNPDLIQGSYSAPGIVLFDEVEKASDEVIRTLLNILDNGQLILSAGNRLIDFRNSLLFMTSNLGVKELNEYHRKQQGWRGWLSFAKQQDSTILDHALHQRFDPEFINRIDRIIQFNSIDHDLVKTLIKLEIGVLNKRLEQSHAPITLDKDVSSFLTEFYDTRFGARDMARHIRRELEPPLARAMYEYPQHSQFIAHCIRNKIYVLPLH